MKTSKKLTIMGLSAATALVAATGAVSSFAWFAVNSSVTATGMVIKATATDAYLQINKGGAGWNETGDFTAISYTENAKELKPTAVCNSVTEAEYDADGTTIKTASSIVKHTAGSASYKWAYATASSVDSYAKASEYKDVSSVIEGNGEANDYALVYDFDLRLKYTASMANVSKDIVANVSFGTASDDALRNAVSVFMVSGEVERNTLTNGNAVKALLFTNTSGTWTCDKEDAVIISGLKATTSDNISTKVRFYAFFNGENEYCKTTNVKTASEYSLNVKFSIKESN